jgi:outer membrane protein TolC
MRSSTVNKLFPISSGVAVLLLAGCMVGPQYKRPAAITAPSFKEAPADQTAEGDGWKPGQPSDQKLKGDWWTMYQDQQLSTLEEQVNSANQTLKAAEANFRAARAAIGYARSNEAPTIGVAPGLGSVRESAHQPCQQWQRQLRPAL